MKLIVLMELLLPIKHDAVDARALRLAVVAARKVSKGGAWMVSVGTGRLARWMVIKMGLLVPPRKFST